VTARAYLPSYRTLDDFEIFGQVVLSLISIEQGAKFDRIIIAGQFLACGQHGLEAVRIVGQGDSFLKEELDIEDIPDFFPAQESLNLGIHHFLQGSCAENDLSVGVSAVGNRSFNS